MCSNCTIAASTSDSLLSHSFYNNTPTFRSYTWSALIPVSIGISGFHVEVLNGEESTTYGNGDAPFPMQDLMVFELEKSCTAQFFINTGLKLQYNMTASVSAPFLAYFKCRSGSFPHRTTSVFHPYLGTRFCEPFRHHFHRTQSHRSARDDSHPVRRRECPHDRGPRDWLHRVYLLQHFF